MEGRSYKLSKMRIQFVGYEHEYAYLLLGCPEMLGREKCVSPAFLWMLLSLVVELQRDLGIQADAKVIVHDTFLHVALSGWKNSHRNTVNSNT